MTLVTLPGEGTLWPWPLPPDLSMSTTTPTFLQNMNATNYASIFIGTIRTEDGASHTVDATGLSTLNFISGANTWASSSVLRIGLATVDTSTTPARAANIAGVITFDVYEDVTFLSTGGVTAYALTPSSGTKTLADGDLVAFAFQIRNRLGTDVIRVYGADISTRLVLPSSVIYTGSVYGTNTTFCPSLCITFSDGTMGFIEGAVAFLSSASVAFSSSTNPNHRGTLFTVPMPCVITGAQRGGGGSGACEYIVVRDPLGTPVVEATYSYAANLFSSGTATASWNRVQFPTPVTLKPNTTYGLILRPTTTTNVNLMGMSMPTAWRGYAPGGATSYGLSRNGTSGAYTAITGTKYLFAPVLQSVEGLTIPPTFQLGA